MSTEHDTTTVTESPSNPSRRQILKALGIGGAAAAASPILQACGRDSKPRGGNDGGKAKITLWGFSMEQVDFRNEAAEKFMEDHSNITVEWRQMDESKYTESLPLAFQSNESPDLFHYVEGALPMQQLIELDWIRPLTPDGSLPDDFKSRFPENSFYEGIHLHDGKLYGYGERDRYIYGGDYWFCRRDLFDQAGLAAENPPTTWDELRETCDAIKSKTGKFPLVVPMDAADINRTWFSLAGSIETQEIFDYKNGRFNFADERIDEAFAFFQELYNAKYVTPGLFDKNFSRGQFAAGEAAIVVDGFWMPALWEQEGLAQDQYVTNPYPFPNPPLPQGRISHAPSAGEFWVSAQTKYPEACWEFIDWLTQPDGWYAQNFIGRGYGVLAYADNAKYLKGEQQLRMVEIAGQNNFRVDIPVPTAVHPDLAKSTAMVDAQSEHQGWEMEVLSQAILENQDASKKRAEVADTRQQILESTLEKEATDGLDVSIDHYAFPDWEYTEHWTPSA